MDNTQHITINQIGNRFYIEVFKNILILGSSSNIYIVLAIQACFITGLSLFEYKIVDNLLENNHISAIYVIRLGFMLSILLHFMNYITEPGIIPKSDGNCDEISEKTIVDISNKVDSMPRIYTQRYCKTCKIVKNKCTSHCSTCNNCVENYDQ